MWFWQYMACASYSMLLAILNRHTTHKSLHKRLGRKHCLSILQCTLGRTTLQWYMWRYIRWNLMLYKFDKATLQNPVVEDGMVLDVLQHNTHSGGLWAPRCCSHFFQRIQHTYTEQDTEIFYTLLADNFTNTEIFTTKTRTQELSTGSVTLHNCSDFAWRIRAEAQVKLVSIHITHSLYRTLGGDWIQFIVNPHSAQCRRPLNPATGQSGSGLATFTLKQSHAGQWTHSSSNNMA